MAEMIQELTERLSFGGGAGVSGRSRQASNGSGNASLHSPSPRLASPCLPSGSTRRHSGNETSASDPISAPTTGTADVRTLLSAELSQWQEHGAEWEGAEVLAAVRAELTLREQQANGLLSSMEASRAKLLRVLKGCQSLLRPPSRQRLEAGPPPDHLAMSSVRRATSSPPKVANPGRAAAGGRTVLRSANPPARLPFHRS